MTSDPRSTLWFDGVFIGLYRADANLQPRRRNDVVIPAEVTAREGYNHVGDLTWDAREGGRILLPLECFYPGRPGGANSCGTGSIGVADPRTLRWRYYVKLDPAEIPKAMWAEVSPDGRLVWTSAGADLLAYRTGDVTRARAAPGAAPIRAVRRLAGPPPRPGSRAPPSTATGCWSPGRTTRCSGSGQSTSRPAPGGWRSSARSSASRKGSTWSTRWAALFIGSSRRSIPPGVPRPTPCRVTRSCTSFRGPRATGSAWRPSRAELVVGRRTRVRFKATAHGVAAAGAVVRFRGQLERTSATGVARFTVTLRHPGQYLARATRADLRPASVAVRALAFASCARASC